VGARSLPSFSSGDELVQKTPGFYRTAAKRLDLQLAHAYEYASHHFGGRNFYLEEMRKNVSYAELVAQAPHPDMLRRQAPSTLVEGVEPYPRDLAKLN
jgi:hypothetical protein